MSEPTVVDARLDKLEQDNRRLKLTVGALLLVLAAVPLIGAVMPEQIPSLIRAEAFHVVDDNGTTRAAMDTRGIIISGKNGNPLSEMNISGFFYCPESDSGLCRTSMTRNGITLSDENGTPRAFMNASGIFYTDENETLRLGMNVDGIRYFDENGNEVWSTTCAPNCPGGGRLH